MVFVFDYEFDGFDMFVFEYVIVWLFFVEIGFVCLLFGLNFGV